MRNELVEQKRIHLAENVLVVRTRLRSASSTPRAAAMPVKLEDSATTALPGKRVNILISRQETKSFAFSRRCESNVAEEKNTGKNSRSQVSWPHAVYIIKMQRYNSIIMYKDQDKGVYRENKRKI